jgi:hypothetical protein
LIKSSTRERWTESFADLRDGFDGFFSRMIGKRDWWPNSERGTGPALIRVRAVGDEQRAIRDEEWLDATYTALKRWQAFRGPKGGVSEERFRTSIARAGPHLARIRGTQIDGIESSQLPELFELFQSLEALKPSRAKWVSISKTLYHLLPELVMPMDKIITARFLGWSSLPQGLDEELLVTLYEHLSSVAHSVGGSRLDELGLDPTIEDPAQREAMRLGRARVIDFAMAGKLGM